jgi:cell wall-associated NlpC family hydrolase
MGDHGPLVGTLQHLLKLPVDGIFGRHTRRAVKQFQRGHHLLVDGQVGPQTWKALLRHRHKAARSRRAHGDGILRLGDRRPAVARVQRMLHIRVNSLYDRRTWLAVRRFQRRHHLVVDGEAGPQTMLALHRAARGGSGKRHPSHHATLGTRLVRVAKRYVGVRYRWGGESPSRGFDCSGLVQYSFAQLGVSVPRVTYDQWHAGRHISRSHLRRGDLVFFHHLSHVGIFLGHGWFLHAPRTGERIHASAMGHGWYDRHYDGAVRIG